MATYDFNSAAGSSSPVDGATYRRPDPHEDWATIVAGTSGRSADATIAQDNLYLKASTTSNQYSGLDRPIFLFNVSTFAESSSNISSISFNYNAIARSDGLAMGNYNVVSSSPASNSALVGADWSTLGTTKLSDDTSIPASTGWQSVALNSAGIDFVKTAIAGDDIVKLGLRFTGDQLGGTSPTWSSAAESYISLNFADNVTDIPYLRIVTSAGTVTVIPMLPLMGVG